MVKFIIEVDEEFISQKADINTISNDIKEHFVNGSAKDSVLKLLMCMPYSTIEDEIKEGRKEFIVNSSYGDTNDNKGQFESVVEHIVLIAATDLLRKRNKENKENKEAESTNDTKASE